MTSSIRSSVLPAFIAILCFAAVVSLFPVFDRVQLETSSRSVEISVDAVDMAGLSARAGTPTALLLREMKGAGVSSIVISETTMADALFRGSVALEKTPRGMVLTCGDKKLRDSLAAMLPGRYGLRIRDRGGENGRYALEIPSGEHPMPEEWNSESPLGYDPALIAAAGEAGLAVFLRPVNVRNSAWLSGESADGFVFDNLEVPGFPGNEHVYGRAISERGQRGVVFEFSRPAGRERLSKSMGRSLVNGHTITPRELEKIADRNKTINRWQRAVKERGIRYLLVRAVPGTGIDENKEYIQHLVTRLEKAGYRTGRAETPRYPESSRIPLRMAVIALVALAVPVAAMVLGTSLKNPFAGYIAVNAVALAGGCVLSACFFDFRFMQRLAVMPGVKLFLLLPVIMTALYVYRDKKPGEFFKRPVTMGHAAIAAVIIAAVYVFMARSGNDAAAWLRPETGLREWLEAVLPARPRTKEFLFAQPLLLAGLATRKRLLLIAGSLAPVSVLNTFFHAHTPFILSLERSVIGMGIGLVLGYLLAQAMKRTS